MHLYHEAFSIYKIIIKKTTLFNLKNTRKQGSACVFVLYQDKIVSQKQK